MEAGNLSWIIEHLLQLPLVAIARHREFLFSWTIVAKAHEQFEEFLEQCLGPLVGAVRRNLDDSTVLPSFVVGAHVVAKPQSIADPLVKAGAHAIIQNTQ